MLIGNKLWDYKRHTVKPGIPLWVRTQTQTEGLKKLMPNKRFSLCTKFLKRDFSRKNIASAQSLYTVQKKNCLLQGRNFMNVLSSLVSRSLLHWRNKVSVQSHALSILVWNSFVLSLLIYCTLPFVIWSFNYQSIGKMCVI